MSNRLVVRGEGEAGVRPVSVGVCLAGLLLLGAVFDATFVLKALTSGSARRLSGCIQSVGFLLAIGLYGWLAARSPRRGEAASGRLAWAALGTGSALLALNLLSNHLAGVLAVVYRPPPMLAAVLIVGGWVALLVRTRRRGFSRGLALAGFVGLIVATRVLGLRLIPFERLSGDMLWTIDRALAQLFSGHFPYRNSPPPMPYFPLTFLAYAPCKWLGMDLRWTNVVCDAMAVFLAFGPRRSGTRAVAWHEVALPLLMLNPTWTYLSVDTHYPPSVLAAVFLGRAVVCSTPGMQTLALGLAVGTNQSFVLFGPILAAGWLREFGPWRMLRLSAGASAVTIGLLAPWLAWDPVEFVRTTLLFRSPLPPEVLEGRISLLPALRGLGLGGLAPGMIVGILVLACVRADRDRQGRRIAGWMALGYVGILLFLGPITFPHYFLPPMALLVSGTSGSRSFVNQSGIRRTSGMMAAPLLVRDARARTSWLASRNRSR